MTEEFEKWRDEMFAEAKKQTLETLPEFMKKYASDENADYSKMPEVAAACAVAAAWAVDSKFGMTNFQANWVMWRFIRKWYYEYNKTGLSLIDYDNMLYPQYENYFDKTISTNIWKSVVKQAKEKLATNKKENISPNVWKHWENIAAGKVPFGFTLSDSK